MIIFWNIETFLFINQLHITPKHSGDLGVATKEPRKGRPAAISRILLRLVMGQEHNTLTLAESAGTVLCRMNKKHSSLHAWVLVKHGKTHTRRNTGMSR
jgi:hypothetical protein